MTENSPKGFSYKFPTTDGFITNVTHLPLFIPVADCAAVAFFDPKQRVIGLLHAGWKGIVHNIIPAMVERMKTIYGSDPSDVLAGISPCLGPCCYQVREDFIETFTQVFPTKARDFFIPQENDTVHFDMWAALHWQLEQSGVQKVEGPTFCTACRVDEFYSHRKEHGKTGRFASVLMLQS